MTSLSNKDEALKSLNDADSFIVLAIKGDQITEQVSITDDACRLEFIDSLGELQAKLKRPKKLRKEKSA